METIEFTLVDDGFIERLSDPIERERWLLLEPHPEFKDHWGVESFNRSFFFDLKDVIGPYKVVSPSSLEAFYSAAQEHDYRVAFFEDPASILNRYECLSDPPSIDIHSTMEGTVNGLLPFQVEGFNFLKDLDGGVSLWQTGTGKSILATSLIQYHRNLDHFDLAFFVAKTHNKVNIQRSLQRYGGIESIVVDGPKDKRTKIWADLAKAPRGAVVVTNYEKFRFDKDEIKALFEDRDILVCWDEMPTKLKNRGTKLYHSVCECLYRTNCPAVNWNKKRPKSLRQWMFSATPIENSPEDFFNNVRLLAPDIYGPVSKFYGDYVDRFSFWGNHQPETWKNLDRMGLKVSHITHKVDKSNPEIADQFPKIIEEPFYIDWDEKDRKVYDALTQHAASLDLDEANVLAMITVAQMLCDAPTMVLNSATLRANYEIAVDEWLQYGGKAPDKSGSETAFQLVEALGDKITDDHHTKLDMLYGLLTEEHGDEKILVFSTFADALLPILSNKLDQWGVAHVVYRGSMNERQKAEDAFKNDSSIRVFLSSDIGSDSLSLEQASVVVNYNLPWKWSTLVQRQNRIHRIVSDFDTVRFYSLLMANSVEDRKMDIINKKMGYHFNLFDPMKESKAAHMSLDDLRWILLG